MQSTGHQSEVRQEKDWIPFTKNLTHAGMAPKCFICTNTIKSHSKPVRWLTLYLHFIVEETEANVRSFIYLKVESF